MPHSFIKIWIHAIWATKEREPLVATSFENILYEFLKKQLEEMGCVVSIINGMPDHIHCLFLLPRDKSIADVIKQVKGSSSHYINQSNYCSNKFAWQGGYAAFAVSESVQPKVYQYIKNQKQHHSIKTFEQEYAEFLKIYGFDSIDSKNG